MANININNSQGTVITVGDRNHHIKSSTNATSNNKVSKGNKTNGGKQKPKWLIVLSWIFIVGCMAGIIISIGIKCFQTKSVEGIHIDWKEWVQFGVMMLGVLLRLY